MNNDPSIKSRIEADFSQCARIAMLLVRGFTSWMVFLMVVSLLNVLTVCAAEMHLPSESDATGKKILTTPQFQDYLHAFVAGVNAKDRKALMALYDPASQTAMSKVKPDILNEFFENIFDTTIPANYFAVVSMVGPNDSLAMEDMGSAYAVRPVALLQVNFGSDSSSGGTVLYIVPNSGKWCSVWASPPDAKKLEAAMEKAGFHKEDEQPEHAVKASGITDFQHDAQSKDEFTKPYRWVAHLTEADSKDRKYEVVQIDQLPDDTTKTKVVVESSMVQPGNDTYGLQVGLSDKTTAGTGNMAEMFGLQEDISVSCVDASNQPTGVGASAFVSLPGSMMTGIDASPNGTPLTDGTLRFARYHSTNAKGDAYLTDVVLRVADAGKAAEGKYQSQVQWSEQECSNPLYLPYGYLITVDDIGKYRVFQEGSAPDDHQANCIHITFTSNGTLDPAPILGARTMPFKIKGQQFQWRVFKTQVSGKPVIRKEMVIPNILRPTKQDKDSRFIHVQIDAETQMVIDTLTPVAGGILRDSLDNHESTR